MFTLAVPVEHEIEPIKKSRFVALAAPVSDEATARSVLDSTRRRFDDARHHCSAWRIHRPAIDRCNDDGEPSGSAGRPILAQLLGRDLTDVAVVVVRYFGGTKLGVGGLVRAYAQATAEALDRCTLVPAIVETTRQIQVDYRDAEAVERAVAGLGGRVTETAYLDRVTLTVAVAETAVGALGAAVANATNGRARIDVDNPS